MVSSVATLKKIIFVHRFPSSKPANCNYLILEGRGVGDTHITGRHLGGDTHITSDMCAGVHISRGYTYHCDTVWIKPPVHKETAGILVLNARTKLSLKGRI